MHLPDPSQLCKSATRRCACEGMDKMHLVHPPACGVSSMIRAGLGLGITSQILLGSWSVRTSEEGFGLVRG